MIFVNLTKNIHGELLKEELAAQGLNTDIVIYTFPEGNKIEMNGLSESDRELAELTLDAHIAPSLAEPTVAEKLASVGLSIEELKTELGL
jgi:hypothetical protein